MIAQHFSTNTLYLALATCTKEVKADAISIWLDHFTKARSQLGILRRCEVALKHTVLHPLTIGFEDFVDLGATLILWNIIRNNNVHIQSTTLFR